MQNNIKYEDIRVEPVRENAVPIVITPYKGFIPSMAVLFQSIIDNSDDKNFYDIIVLHSVISKETQKRYKDIFAGKKNFSLRFFHVLKYVTRYPFFQKLIKENSTHIATYYRLLIPELFSAYEKVIYLDADIIVNENIALMMDFDVSKVMLAAVRDIAGNRFYYTNEDLKKYRDEVLALKNPDNYFNSGVLLINPKAFRDKYTEKEWWEFAASRKWRATDQDILNAACKENVLLISCTWNYVEMGGASAEGHILAEDIEDMIQAAINPCIIHYVGRYKPWNRCSIPYFKEFWKYAVENSFFEDNFNMIGEDLIERRMLEKIQERRVGLKTIKKILTTWLSLQIKDQFGTSRNRTKL